MSERHEAGQPWEELLEHLDSEHWGSRNPAFVEHRHPSYIPDCFRCELSRDEVGDSDYLPAFIPADEPLPEEEFEPTPEGVVYLNAHKFLEAKTSLATAQAILDRILEKVKKDRGQQ